MSNKTIINSLPAYKLWYDMLCSLKLETWSDFSFTRFPIINVEKSNNYILLVSQNNVYSSYTTKKIIVKYREITNISIISYYKKINTKYSFFECSLIINILRTYYLKGGVFKTYLNNDILNDYDFYSSRNIWKYNTNFDYNKSLIDNLNEYNIDLLAFVLHKIIFNENIICNSITRNNFTYTYIYNNNIKIDLNMKTMYNLPSDFYENTLYVDTNLQIKCLYHENITNNMKIKLISSLFNNKNKNLPSNIILNISSYIDDNYLCILKLMYNITQRKMYISHKCCCDLSRFLLNKNNNINNIVKLLSYRILKLEKQNYKLIYTNCNKELCIVKIKNIIDNYNYSNFTISFDTYLNRFYEDLPYKNIIKKIYNNNNDYIYKYIITNLYNKFESSYQYNLNHNVINNVYQFYTNKNKKKIIQKDNNILKDIDNIKLPLNKSNKSIYKIIKVFNNKKQKRYTKFYKENYYNYLYNT